MTGRTDGGGWRAPILRRLGLASLKHRKAATSKAPEGLELMIDENCNITPEKLHACRQDIYCRECAR